jgi:hypothetical protein
MSTRPTRWLARKLGRRGAVLVILGFGFIAVGLGDLLTQEHSWFLHLPVPTLATAVLWMAAGAVAVEASFTRKRRDHTGRGFAALVVPLIVQVFSDLVGGVSALLGYGDRQGGLADALAWGALLALVLTMAGWPEVDESKIVREHRRWLHRRKEVGLD